MLKPSDIIKLQILIMSAGAANTAESGQTADPRQMETMVVTGTRTGHDSWDSPVPTDSISIEEAKARGKQNLGDLLSEQPGVDIVPGIRGRNIRLQGFDSKYVLILIDGQRMTGKMGETFDLNSISLEQVERVEVIRGAGSSLYGSDAIAGVVNVILKRPLKDSQEAQVRYGTDKQIAAGASASFVGKSSDQTITISGAKLEPWRRTSSPASTLSGTQDSEITWKHTWNLSQGFKLGTRLGYQSNLIEGTDVSTAGAVWDRKNLISRQTLHLSPEWRLENGSIFKLDSQYQIYEDVYKTELRLRTSVNTKQVNEEKLQEHTLTYQHELGYQHYLTWGAAYIDEYLESDRLKTDHVQRERLSLFAQDEWSSEAIRGLSIVPGIRYDDDSQFGDHTSGKLALRYELSPRTIIRPSYGEGYRAPAFKELYLLFENVAVGYVVEGYEDLQPESSKSYQMAIDHRLSDEQSLSGNIYQNEIRDLIYAVLLPDQNDGRLHYSYRNVARVRNRGADVTYKWAASSLDLTLSYQFLEARDLESDSPLEGRAKHTVAWQLNRWKLTDKIALHFTTRWTGPQTIYNAEGEPTLSRATHWETAGALYELNKSWSSGMTIENLSNGWEDRILQVRPRSYIISLNWNHQNDGKE